MCKKCESCPMTKKLWERYNGVQMEVGKLEIRLKLANQEIEFLRQANDTRWTPLNNGENFNLLGLNGGLVSGANDDMESFKSILNNPEAAWKEIMGQEGGAQ